MVPKFSKNGVDDPRAFDFGIRDPKVFLMEVWTLVMLVHGNLIPNPLKQQ